MGTGRKYLVAVALLAVFAVAFGVFGSVAPPLAEEGSPVQPQQGSSSESMGHFHNPPTYDSGWVDIRDKLGQYFALNHNLKTSELVVDLTGKQTLEQPGNMLWNKTYGGTLWDYAYALVQTSDGGYVLAGETWFTEFQSDCRVVKTDATGNMLWNETYGGDDFDAAFSIVQTTDGGYAIAGYTCSLGDGMGDAWLVKTDLFGNEQWNKTYGGLGSDGAYALVQTGDGGYAMAGCTNSSGAGGYDGWLIKTDANGQRLWDQTYGGEKNDILSDITHTGDGGYAMAGWTNSSVDGSFPDAWLVKTDLAGNMLWNKTYGGADIDFANAVIQTADGGYALAGSSNSWLIKTDLAGNMVWNRTRWLSANIQAFVANSVVETGDGGYAIAGDVYYSSHIGAALVITDPNGNSMWNRTYGTLEYHEECRALIRKNGSRGYIMAGCMIASDYDYPDFWLVEVADAMNLEHRRNLGVESGLVITGMTNNTIILHRNSADPYWNYVRLRVWLIKEPSWIYGDINMDGIVDNKDLYIIGRNYGKTFSLLSLTGIIAVASIHIIKTRKQVS